MLIARLDIIGFRGFAQEQTLRFAQPNGEDGSGLTVLVGPNSGGKSTIVESVQAFSGRNVSFSEGKRNKAAGDRVMIRLEEESGKTQVLRTVDTGGSMTIREPEGGKECYVLPSRRFFSPYFGLGGDTSRQGYLSNRRVPANRSNSIGDFAERRLFAALKRREEFDTVLGHVMDPVPDWTIDQSDEGNYYVKLNSAGQFHNSDGMGEGIVSLLFIVDALYDSSPEDLIVIDEPELSLHPVYQRRLAPLFAKYAKDRQIVLATHSPYFVDFEHILNGAEVARVHKNLGGCVISQLTRESTNQLEGLLKNRNNPHLLGLEAREAFFQEDGVIVVEGQEDVVYYSDVFDQLVDKGNLSSKNAKLTKEHFFGWGAGGAGNIEKIVPIFYDLGFEKVVAVFDQNERGRICDLQKKYPGYLFRAIPADDIRTKEERNVNAARGLLDEEYRIRPEFKTDTARLFNDICVYLQP
ncbi:MAG: ATP-binding protein [Caldilineaceae bacterium SB0670_bin_27]|uniref:ATP-binding protein n=1 Tax=Caldilineaceae bacterium SB0664_bin_27 TaxID=2605260 RepID=A0A6B0YMR9_9CHLR|nr:ATP-binding protein [Caldilineaceae bacterium SB0664_bin_27]MYJ79301.1 ATP-binding protein [Caldilineaceae bacterium SB0670_bin_27]